MGGDGWALTGTQLCFSVVSEEHLFRRPFSPPRQEIFQLLCHGPHGFPQCNLFLFAQFTKPQSWLWPSGIRGAWEKHRLWGWHFRLYLLLSSFSQYTPLTSVFPFVETGFKIST